MKKLGHDNLFNPSLFKELDEISSSNIFIYKPEYQEVHTLTCAISGRLNSAIKYLNNHKRYPKSEDEFILFMVYSCMVIDGVKNLLNKIFKEDFNKNEKKYFLKMQQGEFFPVEESDFLSDDKMFEYLRALIFAHPFHIDRHLKKYFSEQISPWFSVDQTWTAFSEKTRDCIEIQIFVKRENNDGKHPILLELSFQSLKEYVNSRYLYFEKAIQWFKGEQLKVEEEWKAEKINRNLDLIDLILEINEFLKKRFMGRSGVKQFYYYLSCPCTEKSNELIFNKYKQTIINRLPEICDAVDNLDINKIDNIISDLTRISKKMSFNTYQQLEGIYLYLHESFQRDVLVKGSNEEEALSLVNEFAKGFAKKWVKIDTTKMCNSEIKMLIAAACYFEKKKQEGKLKIINGKYEVK